MEEAPENNKESSHSAHVNGMNERINSKVHVGHRCLCFVQVVYEITCIVVLCSDIKCL
jgi:hypothetical protein